MNMREKITKIIEKAKSTSSEAEADMLMAKAAELMERHQIEAFELGDQSDPIGMTVGARGQSGPSAYRPLVQMALAKYYGARVIRMWDTARVYRIEIVGPESARITTELMTDYVWDQVKAQATKLAAEGQGKRDAMIRYVANALVHRINMMILERQPAKVGSATEANSLVVQDGIKSWVENHYEHLVKIKGKGRSSTDAAKQAAAGISIHRQTGGGKATLRLA